MHNQEDEGCSLHFPAPPSQAGDDGGHLHFFFLPSPTAPPPSSYNSSDQGHGRSSRLVEELRQVVHEGYRHEEEPSSPAPERLDYFGFPATTAAIRFDADQQRVWYPHENHIPVNLHLLTNTLLNTIGQVEEETGCTGARESFSEFCGMYLYVVQAKHDALTRELQLYQTLFNPALRRSATRAELGRSSSSGDGDGNDEEVEARRERMINSFIHNFVRTMRQANFNPLTQDQIRFAANPEQILFGVPMRIDWDKLDSRLLEGYFRELDEPNVPPAPPFARHAKNMAARSLKNNSLNCNKSVLSYIHEAAIEQEIKEALLAYFMIWQWGSGIRKDELDAAIEYFIKSRFGVEVDFEVDDALHKLLASSVVYTRRVPGRGELYMAVPPHEALGLVQDELLLSAKRHFA